MSAIVINHPLLALTAAFLGGFLVEWLLELFYFRRRIFDTEAALRRREREVADIRFEAARADERLKNRELELEATQKARQTAETRLALTRQEVEHLKSELRLSEAEQAQAASRHAEVLAAWQRESSAREALRRTTTFLEAETARLSALVFSAEADAAIASAALATETSASAVLRSNLTAQARDLDAALVRTEVAEKAWAAAVGVQATVLESLRTRDQQLGELRADLAGKEAERTALSQALATADDRAGALSAQVRQLKEDTDRLFDELQTIQGRATAGENKAEASARALLQAEALLKKAEAEIAERERKLREYRTAFEDAAKENTRLNQESARMSAQLLAGETARKQAEVEKTRLQEDIKSLETTEGAAREELISIRARLRVREAELEASSTAKQALESELQAVSASHARLEVELAATKPSPPATPDLFPVLDKTTESVPSPVAMVPREVSIEPPVVTAPVETENQIPEYTVDCPQRLGEVSGVTSQMVSRLYAAGIGSFWQLARADHDRLSGILETDLGELTLFNFDLICADAERKARETSSIGRKWSGESPDDLTMLDGLSVSHQRQLNDAGICTFAGLGKADPNDLAKICKPGAGRVINYNVWIEQACLLAGSDSV